MQFDQALALHHQGRTEDAARGYEALLSADPAHLDALIHLGVLRLGQSRTAEAEALLRRAVAGAPDCPEAHANLAAAIQASRRHEDAVAHYERALQLKPGMVDARFGLAACLQALGRHEAAIACYETILAAEPTHAEASYGLATLLAELGRAHAAIAQYRAALAADPDFAEASYALGGLLARSGSFEEAVGHFRQALDVDPDYTDARVALGTALLRLDREGEAIAAFRVALASEPDRAEAHHWLGTALGRKRRYAEAVEHFRAALAGDPDNVDTMTAMASALIATGQHDPAMALCRRAIVLRPDSASAASVLGLALAEIGEMSEALTSSRRAVTLASERPEFAFNLVQIAKVRPGDPVLEALESMLPQAASLSAREQCWLHFALAKSYDDIGERSRGFAHLLEGNAIKRAQSDYNEAAVLAAMDRTRQVFTAELIARRRDGGAGSDTPVFIVGMPRSGTTLLEQMLASHPSVFGAGERLELPEAVDRLSAERFGMAPFPEAVWTMTAEQFRQMGAQYVAALRPLAPDAARITDKMPSNFCFVGLIRLILPNARIIHMLRDPVDTCLSCFSKLFSAELSFTYDLTELGRFYRAYQRLMAHWRAVLPPGAMLEVRYETLVQDFAAEARRVVAYCGLPWDARCLEFHKTSRPVRTASVAQVRQPIYQTSVGRWRPDRSAIRPLLEALGAS